ncbi:MAG TPA: alpha-amylase family glycosyl hydrolase, partial [Anaerolineae bacterium]|nr:alpha-amylase family glycosyl hydrolase [Anaerolineae bacterium]
MATHHRLLVRISLLALLVLGLLAGCGRPSLPNAVPTAALAPAATIAPASAWWNDSVFYEVFVRSFQDSDGDGIGDLQGLIDKLDYLNDGDPTTTDDLGVTGIWLMPVAQSPSYHG